MFVRKAQGDNVERSLRSETVADWECVAGCPVALLDAQSGSTGASGDVAGGLARVNRSGIYGELPATLDRPKRDDEGGASRFYTVTHWSADDVAGQDGADFLYAAKAPKRERPMVDGVRHVTVKPLAVMRWLVRLVTPPGGTVLEPFAGSGTTVEAALIEGFDVVAMEQAAEYLPLIESRVARFEAGEARGRVPAGDLYFADVPAGSVEDVDGQLDLFGDAA